MKLNHNQPEPKATSSLRPDPATLFGRITVASAVVAANALAFSGAAQAQSAEAEAAAEGETTTLSEVVVTAQTDSYKPELLQSPAYTAPLLDVPQTISIVPEALIREQGATTMREVLRNVPGISMQAGEGPFPTADALSIRGFSARTDIYVDGIRDIGSYARDPFNVEQVEVSKGPSSTVAGRGTTGGAVNLVTKTPKLDRFYTGEIGFGTDQYKRFTLDLNQPLNVLGIEGAAFRVNALWTDYDVAGRDWVNNNRWAIAPSIAFGLGTETRFTLTYLHQQEDNIPDYGLPFVPVRPANGRLVKELDGHSGGQAPVSNDTWYGLKKRDYLKTTVDQITFHVEHDVNENFTLSNLLRWGRSEVKQFATAPRFISPTTSTDIGRTLKTRDQVDWIFADRFDLNLKFNTFGLEHSVNTGIEYAHESSRNYGIGSYTRGTTRSSGNNPIGSFHNPNSEDFPNAYYEKTGRTQTTSNTFSLYFGDTVKIHEKFEISGGVRWDRFSTEFESHTYTPDTTTVFNRVDNMVSWRVAPVFKPVPNGSFYVAYGTSFNPSAEGLSLSATNAEVAPEENRSFEVGTKWDLFDKRLSLSGAVFLIEKSNARTPGLDPTDPPIVLEGKQRVKGFELGMAGAITDKWQVYTGYSYLDSEIVRSNNEVEIGKRLPNTPQQTFTFWTTYQLPWDITVGGGAQYVGSRFSQGSSHPNDNRYKSPDYWLFDAMVSYKITENITARINVYNIADEKFVDRASGQHYVPGAGRSGTLSLAFNF